MTLPIKPPYPPMEALLVNEIPAGENWEYEPKWDGFRCIAFRDGKKVELQSKSGQALGRYFPEIVEALLRLKASKFVLDGELVIPAGSAGVSPATRRQARGFHSMIYFNGFIQRRAALPGCLRKPLRITSSLIFSSTKRAKRCMNFL